MPQKLVSSRFVTAQVSVGFAVRWSVHLWCLLFALASKCQAAAATSTYENDRPANEPPQNPYLADSSWPMTHRNTYNQASTNLPGPTATDVLQHDSLLLSGTPSITLATSPDEGTLWFHGPLSTGTLDASGTKLQQQGNVISHQLAINALAGAYVLVDADGIFYAFHDKTLSAYIRATDSSVQRILRFSVSEPLLRSQSDYPVGLSMMYDGNLVFGTRQGNLHVVTRNNFRLLSSLRLGDKAIPEELSNNMAVDENNGIYVVSSTKMRKIQWDGIHLLLAWESAYNVGPNRPAAGRLGKGSGTTPTLMGTTADSDRFVVIADGEVRMNLVLFWRDNVPSDWIGLPGKDRRIAAEVPIQFGNASATSSVTEQSVLVRGYGAVVVNNDYGVSLPEWTPNIINQLFVLGTSFPRFAPKGIEKFEWNPSSRTLESVWSNQLSCPNGIPTMSEASNLVYCIGQRNMKWGVEAMSWSTGKSSFFYDLGYRPRYNSAYSALQIGVDRRLYSGSISGSLRIQVKKAEPNAKQGLWTLLKKLRHGV